MSAFVGQTPVVRLRLENLFLKKSYPAEGFVEGVVDTGYDGFVAVPRTAFESLSLGLLKSPGRGVRLADGSRVKSQVGLGTALVVGTGTEVDGPIESIPGLGEVLVGTRFLSRFRLSLDYCLRRAELKICR